MNHSSGNQPYYNDVPEDLLRRNQQYPSPTNSGVDPFGDSDLKPSAQHATGDYKRRDSDDDEDEHRSNAYAWQLQQHQPNSQSTLHTDDPYYKSGTMHDDDYYRTDQYASRSDDTIAVADGPKYTNELNDPMPAFPKATPPRGEGFQGFDYSDQYDTPALASPTLEKGKVPFLSKLINGGQYPLEQRIEAKRRGSLIRQQRPYVTYALTAAMAAVMIYEFAVNWKAQGSPFSFKPVVNPLLGPSQSVLIETGARFAPCMKHVEDAPPTFLLGCANNTANPATSICTIEELCKFGGFQGKEPNQWFRFITPIFLHAGLVHILLNMFVQWTLAGQVEREMGSVAFLLLYFAAGIFGNILGGNFAMVGLPSVGASGAIFGTVGTLWVDLIAHWQFEHKPVRKLMILIVELAIGVALGYVPGVDNFAHLGGFLLGVLSAVVLYPIISTTKRHSTIVWASRAVALVLAIVLYVVLTRNFYTGDPYKACSWCRYLSCIPSSLNHQCKGTGLPTVEST